MPFRSMYGNTIWIPSEIDAYHAVKITNLQIIASNASGGYGNVEITFDEDRDGTAPEVGKAYSKIHLRFSIVANGSIVIPINGINKIIGDRLEIYLTGHTASIIVFYEVIRTKFSEHGQAEKTFRRTVED